ncbi:hypothetical protein [Streptomyces sp. CMB-StM0423]|uniref:hypothetical protein n=1 Tax=Streptomyces sp. CMB-StM0423 TaxID=2059884 RepID=UPI000C70FB72|nr:hypothetical protein [Streptomyces sp. CMB-StM0423]AUH43322.1 hypothetical protein CXR04_27005 [Streptomyces sp. CMB-StM0423]
MAKHHKHDSTGRRHGGKAAFQEALNARNERAEEARRQSSAAAHNDAKSQRSRMTPQVERRGARRNRG